MYVFKNCFRFLFVISRKYLCVCIYKLFQIGRQYIFQNVWITPANKRFNSFKNDFEMQLNTDSIVTLDDDEETKLPLNLYSFVTIEKIQELIFKDSFVGL